MCATVYYSNLPIALVIEDSMFSQVSSTSVGAKLSTYSSTLLKVEGISRYCLFRSPHSESIDNTHSSSVATERRIVHTQSVREV